MVLRVVYVCLFVVSRANQLRPIDPVLAALPASVSILSLSFREAPTTTPPGDSGCQIGICASVLVLIDMEIKLLMSF